MPVLLAWLCRMSPRPRKGMIVSEPTLHPNNERGSRNREFSIILQCAATRILLHRVGQDEQEALPPQKSSRQTPSGTAGGLAPPRSNRKYPTMIRIAMVGLLLVVSSGTSMAQSIAGSTNPDPSSRPGASVQASVMTMAAQPSRNISRQVGMPTAPAWSHAYDATFGPTPGEDQFESGYSSEGGNN